ncbi:hypothetical protein OG894_44685 (plasmid) [Streptomyces sp. NBC_01724]|uniref:hypothetical protein n=1 Tax=Streptomyces sp. NBC_01724 TaxID=2975922 RepID=UPI002E316BDF|nr:hypothetical protein [Streptomyces sp. NBC_01724]
MARRMSSTGLNRASIWEAGVFAVAMLSLTACAVFSGDEEPAGTASKGGSKPSASATAKRGPTYGAPSEWTEPKRWAVLPRNQRVDTHGNKVDWPQSTDGAEAMLVAANSTAVEGDRTSVDVQLGIYESYISQTDHSEVNAEKIELAAIQTDKQLRTKMGLAAGSDLPAGAYVRSQVIGFKVIEESPGEVSAWLLARATTKSGEMDKEKGSYTRSLGAAVWEDGDWKLSTAATRTALQQVSGQERPPIAAPGDEAFNTGGWTAIREAS